MEAGHQAAAFKAELAKRGDSAYTVLKNAVLQYITPKKGFDALLEKLKCQPARPLK